MLVLGLFTKFVARVSECPPLPKFKDKLRHRASITLRIKYLQHIPYNIGTYKVSVSTATSSSKDCRLARKCMRLP